LLRYHRLAARRVEAEVSTVDGEPWFHAFLPQRLLLGDPGARDALLHGIQVCVPDVTLLPIGVDRVEPAGPGRPAGGSARLVAVARAQHGDTFEYDVSVLDSAGAVLERWSGLRLRAVGRLGDRRPWPPALLGPLLERRLEDVLGVRLDVVLEPHPEGLNGNRRAVTATAAARAAGRPVTPRYRPDGAPEPVGGRAVSAAHSRTASLLVRGAEPLACDLETVDDRPEQVWAGMLGRHATLARTLAAERAEPAAVASTRVWSAVECLRKAGLPPDAPLVLEPAENDWVLFRSGRRVVATRELPLAGDDHRVVVGVLADGGARDA
jgi:enediyne polyketide synthase